MSGGYREGLFRGWLGIKVFGLVGRVLGVILEFGFVISLLGDFSFRIDFWRFSRFSS